MITKSELASQPISTIQTLFSEGTYEPNDLIDCVLENIRRNESKVHAFIHIESEERLRQKSEWARKAIRDGNDGLLAGIPVAIKDNTYVAEMPCTAGSIILKDFMPSEDAPAVSRLRAQDAIIIGKTNLDEMAAFGIATDNPYFGQTLNPWNLKKIPGGSSGGSAAAVASGEAVVSTGTDTGGSVRIPASLCGLVGSKPTYGRISRSGTIGMSWSLDHFGVITRSVRDAELLTWIISDRDSGDSSTSSKKERIRFEDSPDLSGMKIGVQTNLIRQSSDALTKLFDKSVEVIENLGASMVNVELPHFEDISPAIFAIALSEASAYHEKWFRESHDLYGRSLKSFIELGFCILATQYLKAQRLKTIITSAISRKLHEVDAILTPTTPSVAPDVGQESVMIQGKSYPAFQILSENTYPFNFLGVPAISIPNGFSDGLPSGLQIVTSHWDEEKLYRIGDAFQQVTDYHKQVPEI